MGYGGLFLDRVFHVGHRTNTQAANINVWVRDRLLLFTAEQMRQQNLLRRGKYYSALSLNTAYCIQ